MKFDLSSVTQLVQGGLRIRPVLRYGLPSHLQPEIHNPDNLTEAQICEGGKYRACVKRDRCNQYHEIYVKGKWVRAIEDPITKAGLYSDTYRLPADVPWPDWEAGQATPWPKWYGLENEEPDPKDARIAELEEDLRTYTRLEAEWSEKTRWVQDRQNELGLIAGTHRADAITDYVKRLEAQLATSPWRPMSEVPTEEDADSQGYVIVRDYSGAIFYWKANPWPNPEHNRNILAWMPVPKFHGWPDPLADLLKAHGVEVTPEILAALNAWKGVEK